MEKWKSFYLDKKEIARNTFEFFFEKPEGFEYIAGQHAIFTLKELPVPDKRGGRRALTLSSAPFEKELKISTRITESGFKQSLLKLEKSSPVEIWGPKGEFFPKSDNQPICFLAGGIGIAPFHSIIKNTMELKNEKEIFLFYSNRTENDSPYHLHYKEVFEKEKKWKYFPIFTKSMGYALTSDLLSENISHLNDTDFFICGPSGFVNSMKEQLVKLKIDAQKMHLETLFGY